ncbi:MAG: HEAT repeat domain-containing protein [Chloroflexota bacterium]
MFSLILWQAKATWQFDFLSALVGVLVGVLLALAGQRVRPVVMHYWRQTHGRMQQRLAQARAGVEGRLMEETAVYTQRYHLGQKWASLEQIFVSPRFLLPPADIDPYHLPDWGAGQLDFVWPELAANVATPPMPEMGLSQLLLTGQRVAILAEPGAGKTTLLAYMAYLCATATHDGDHAFLANRLPVLLHLAELDVTGDMTDALAPLVDVLQRRSSSENRAEIDELLQQKARTGNLLLLLDGWDELASAQHELFLNWLRRLCKSYADVHMIAVTAVTDYGPLLSLGFTWTILRPWRPREVELFAARWAKVLSNNPLPINRYWIPGRQPLDITQRFWMVAFGKHVSAATEPRRQYEQMAMSLPAFYTQGLSIPQQKVARLFWQHLAYAQKSQRLLSLAPDDVQRLADEALAAAENLDEPVTQQDLLASLAQSPLFVQDGNGRFRFLSGVWRDFLAAQYMVAHEIAPTDKVRDPYWSGVLRFYVAQVDAGELANPLLQAEVTSLMRNGLFQVASWMPEASDAGEWRRRTLILLGQLARQRTFTRLLRQRAAAALVQTAESGTMAFVKQLLERSDPFLRRTGVVALSYLGLTEPGEVVKLLETFLEDGDGLVRQTAVAALAWLATPVAEKPLLAALIQGDEGMSQTAAKCLALNGKEGVEILREALEDESAQVRRAAMEGLLVLAEPWVEKALAQVERKDADWEVRAAATDALNRLRSRSKAHPWRPLAPKQQRWLVEYAAQENRVVPDGAAAQPFLVQVLAESPQSAIRTAAALTLGQFPQVESIPALETAVRDSDPQVQEAAFTTLCLIHRAFTP